MHVVRAIQRCRVAFARFIPRQYALVFDRALTSTNAPIHVRNRGARTAVSYSISLSSASTATVALSLSLSLPCARARAFFLSFFLSLSIYLSICIYISDKPRGIEGKA